MLKELRRSPRLVCRVPLILVSEGAPVVAHTGVINRHGAMILSERDWRPETHIEMQNQTTKESTPCRVVWRGGESRPGLYKLGVEMLEDHPNFWGANYPDVFSPDAVLE